MVEKNKKARESFGISLNVIKCDDSKDTTLVFREVKKNLEVAAEGLKLELATWVGSTTRKSSNW